MLKRFDYLVGLAVLVAVISLPLLPHAKAQISELNLPVGQATPGKSADLLAQNNRRDFQGRGIAHGAAFTRGRNANVSLTIDRDNFGFELAEPPGTRARVQYRGAIVRQPGSGSFNSGNFTLDGRVRSFTSSANLRVLNNTTGTCRIEVFDSRVISSSCRTVASDSSTQFLGLEQF